ncbi:MAG: DAK2 domain-containing protein [Clostridia bacterium]|nr:DAK2 domain-containing protein [Clostridia bacterium]MBQ8850767.1 DAK2 domain-containing protein [Clostridia bacterium]
MSRQTIDGRLYSKMLEGGAASLALHIQEINDLNVFPVADGDTGTNMARTINGGVSAVAVGTEERISAVCGEFAKGVLLAARGNSGVILSQIFAGIADGISQYDSVGACELARAYKAGIERSYSAVQNPTEGTILTVFRESADYAAKNIDESSTVDDFFRLHIEEGRRSLVRTKEILPVLAESDVVDSGAAGYMYIAEGMYQTLQGKAPTMPYNYSVPKETAEVDITRFTRDSVLEFGYCTEFLLRLTTVKCDPDSFEISELIQKLEALGGESIVAYKQDDIVKVHVHTFTPGSVFSTAQAYGEFLTVKVENMSLGHSGAPAKKTRTNKKFSVLAVATGDGLSALFTDMGADRIIAGGQTANPSIEEFIEAFESCDTENIIVLPNNKNVILAARQAAELYDKAKVYIVETKNLMQGYSALSVITPGIKDMDALCNSARNAAEGVTGIEITQAVRDASMNSMDIKEGDFIAITEGEINAVSDTAEDAAMDALSECDTDLCEMITVFVGKGVSEERRVSLTERIEEEYPDCEVTFYEGGQDVYDYMLALE